MGKNVEKYVQDASIYIRKRYESSGQGRGIGKHGSPPLTTTAKITTKLS